MLVKEAKDILEDIHLNVRGATLWMLTIPN
jgi:hypothetical protein